MNVPLVEFTKVCFSYGRHEVLHNVSFTIEANSFVGIVGPNGGGKTTLLRLLLGLIKPERGTIRVFGKSPQKARAQTGYVMQHMEYDSRFPATVMDIVLMGRVHNHWVGPYSREDKRHAEKALEEVGMKGMELKPFAELSGGQQQRTLIAQALSGEPKILILDEPTANIDIEGEQAIHSTLSSLKEKMTILSVSHNVNTVISTVSHVLCVNRTAVINPIDELHPDTIAKTYGGTMAVLHHAMNCHVFDHSRTQTLPHGAELTDRKSEAE
ncbi:MAG: ATP-binding cassette domain-containing protein [Chitinivibrionales bacterium]|nr:ATP-binding cassette domain-containing protein [Chitinivibrionales bacterium]